MIAKFIAPLLLLATAGAVQAQQQDPSELKERILKQVREKLAKERARLLKRFSYRRLEQNVGQRRTRQDVVLPTSAFVAQRPGRS